MSSKTAICYCVHDDHTFLGASLSSYVAGLPIYVFVSEVAWDGSSGDWLSSSAIAKAHSCKVITGRWQSEEDHRRAAFDYLSKEGFGYVFIPDSDEVIEHRLLDTLCTIAEQHLADRVYVTWDTYWGPIDERTAYVIRPREGFNPALLINLEQAQYDGVRNFSSGRPLLLTGEHGIVHHLSYAGPAERIRRKISTYGHRDEVRARWYEAVYEQWHYDKLMQNLHPTHPEAYRFAERIYVPAELAQRLSEGEELTARALKNLKEPVAV